MKRKDLRQIKSLLKRGETLYYNMFSQNDLLITNDWEVIRRYNHLGKFPRWEDYTFSRIFDLDFETLDQIIEGERNREFLVYVEILFREA